jgi:hypothetical protein
MTPGQAKAALDLRWQAQCIIDQLLHPALDAGVSMTMLSKAFLDPIRFASLMLTVAENNAVNNTPAEPDVPGATAYCGWCGSTQDLIDDSVVPQTGERLDDPVWACSDTGSCVDRRKLRYPDDLALVEAAQDKLDLAMAAAAPAVLALAAVRGAQDQVALTGPRLGAQPRPAPPQAARWSHTLCSPAHRTHLLSRSR